MEVPVTRVRNFRGRFAKKKIKDPETKGNINRNVIVDHNYCPGTVSESSYAEINDALPRNVNRESWKEGRRVIELDILLSNLKYCKFCRLGPIPLTYYNIIGEQKKGLGGYLYVLCQNPDCEKINRAAYGKTHRTNRGGISHKRSGMPSFAVNTKLGTAMIDNIGGPKRVNNFLTTINVPAISNSNLKKMERRAGVSVEKVARRSTENAATDAYEQEVRDISCLESEEAAGSMEILDEDLGVAILPDSSPNLSGILKQMSSKAEDEDDWTDDDDDDADDDADENNNLFGKGPRTHRKPIHMGPRTKSRKNLISSFPCRTRSGMSCSVDTAWQKRGFNSLTSHTFFMSKAKYGKKVVKAVVNHRTCGTCKWWARNKPDVKVPLHRCVHNHKGSARMMESVSGYKGLVELKEHGTPVEYVEGDGDSTLLARARSKNILLKKRYDKNHIIKNFGKHLYKLSASKQVKLSKNAVTHLQKCLSYCLSKNQGDKHTLKENLKAIVPHQFGDHTLCQESFCGFLKDPNEKYQHKSLPFKAPLKDVGSLKSELENIIQPIIANSDSYADIGSSQQCEHANREVALRAPKSLHYGESESLDFRVQATAACINEGRQYLCQANTEAELSPGVHTMKFAEKCMKNRLREERQSMLPSTKRRRLILKQERAVYQSAQEALEGSTYQSGIELEEQVPLDIQQLPDAVPRGEFKPVKLREGSPTVIAFDLETTDLIRGGIIPHITQIAAVEVTSGSKFNTYITPKVPITLEAQQVTGISCSNNILYVKGKEVGALDITTGLHKFCNWLNTFDNVILMAHNGRRFDYPVLVSAMFQTDLIAQFFTSVLGCLDSLSLFKKVYPGRSSYKQEDLVLDILKSKYSAHDALEDVCSLSSLFSHAAIPAEELLKLTFSPKAVYNNQLFLQEKARNMPSLHVLVANGVCKTATAENIAGSGLSLKHLKIIFKRDGEDGLRSVFVGKNREGQPRVTSANRTLDSVMPKLSDYLSKEST